MAKAINRSGGTPAQQPGAEKEKAPTQIDTTLKPFWVSWWSEKLAFELHSPWWITGESHDGRKTVCAAVMASDQATALNTLLEAHDNPLDFEIRFSEEKPIGWSPFSDRFPRADWMDWPEAANTPAPLGDGGEAFPRPASVGPDYLTGEPAAPVDPQKGMSLRDYFAAKAMAALIVSGNSSNKPTQHDIASGAYAVADAMLAARKAVRQ